MKHSFLLLNLPYPLDFFQWTILTVSSSPSIVHYHACIRNNVKYGRVVPSTVISERNILQWFLWQELHYCNYYTCTICRFSKNISCFHVDFYSIDRLFSQSNWLNKTQQKQNRLLSHLVTFLSQPSKSKERKMSWSFDTIVKVHLFK